LSKISEAYRLHPLAVEDIHNTGQLPKAEEFDARVFAALSRPRFEHRVRPNLLDQPFLAADWVCGVSARGPLTRLNHACGERLGHKVQNALLREGRDPLGDETRRYLGDCWGTQHAPTASWDLIA
jgi:hypothetical protein